MGEFIIKTYTSTKEKDSAKPFILLWLLYVTFISPQFPFQAIAPAATSCN